MFFKKKGIENARTIDEAYEILTKRPGWNKLPKSVLRRICDHANEIRQIGEFCETAEMFNSLKHNFIPLSKDKTSDDLLLTTFALTMYQLGRKFQDELAEVAHMPKELKFRFVSATLAFEASLLCDPYYFSSYYALIMVHGYMENMTEDAITWHKRFTARYEKLLSISDEDRTPFQEIALNDIDSVKKGVDELVDELGLY